MEMLLIVVLCQAHAAGEFVDVFGGRDAAEKAAKEADAAAAQFKALFGVAPMRGAVVLTTEGKPEKDKTRDLVYAKHGARWIWRWEANKSAEPDETMAHELGHLFLIFWIHGATPPGLQYGSLLPDWLDEGVASVIESPNGHAAYAAEMCKRIAADSHLPLGEFFNCLHPDSREKCKKSRAGDRWLFYAQSYSVTAFVIDRYGAEAIRAIVGALKERKPIETALGTKGLPKTLADLESAWKKWASEQKQ
jgi:hypothetical protein